MTTRVVRDAHGRQWTVRSELDWRTPATSDEFEHDVSVGNAAAIVLLVLVVALGVTLIWWTPDDVVVPAWVVMLILLAILFFPARWALRRPWTVVAETDDNKPEDREDQKRGERWVGSVRGILTQHQQVNRVARSIEDNAAPAYEGPLQPVA